MYTKSFWKAAFERGARTFAQATGAALLAGGTGLLDVPWENSLSVGGLAALLSLLMSVGLSGTGAEGPGVTETVAPAEPPQGVGNR